MAAIIFCDLLLLSVVTAPVVIRRAAEPKLAPAEKHMMFLLAKARIIMKIDKAMSCFLEF